MAYFLFALSFICVIATLYPFVIYPLTLYIVRGLSSQPLRPEGPQPDSTYALCVCAYNEEAVIQNKIENLLTLKRAYPQLEILVYVDAASDRTAEILQNYTNDIKLFVAQQRQGKTHGMNLLVSETSASIIVFSDANVMMDVKSIDALHRYFADPEVGCVCGHLRYVNGNQSATSANGSLYWRLEEQIKQLESDTGSVMGADGSLFAIRRKLHHPPPDDVIDDMYVSLNILCEGFRVVRAPDVIAYEQSVVSSHEEFKRKIRIACQAFNVHRMLWHRLSSLPIFERYKYISHKFLRWLAIYWIAFGAIFFLAGMLASGIPGLAVLALIALVSGGLYLALRYHVHIVEQIADILTAFAGTGIGVWRSLMGDRFQTWSPATSIRKRAGDAYSRNNI